MQKWRWKGPGRIELGRRTVMPGEVVEVSRMVGDSLRAGGGPGWEEVIEKPVEKPEIPKRRRVERIEEKIMAIENIEQPVEMPDKGEML